MCFCFMDSVILCDESREVFECLLDGPWLPLCFLFHMVGIDGLVFLAANNDRGRFSGWAGYRNKKFRGGGNFSGGNFSVGRGYGRNDFEGQFDFSNRTRGNAGRNEETGHRVYQNGEEKPPAKPVEAA